MPSAEDCCSPKKMMLAVTCTVVMTIITCFTLIFWSFNEIHGMGSNNTKC